MKKQKKYRLSYFKIMLFLFLFLLSTFGSFLLFQQGKEKNKLEEKTGYIASTTTSIPAYGSDYLEIGTIPRGAKITFLADPIFNQEKGKQYQEIIYQNQNYYVDLSYIVERLEDTVLEKNLFVRTPVTVYQNKQDSKILSMIKKGEEVAIEGFDYLFDDGSVHKYKIKYKEIEGYAYAKYFVGNKEEAIRYYDEENTYQIHMTRGDSWGGGDGGSLDFYPFQKANFEHNVMPDEVRALYLNTGVIGNVDAYIELAKKSNINAFVVDIKDNASPGYASEVMKQYSQTNYQYANNSYETYKQAITKIKENGFYVIGRITVFKDNYYALDHIDSAIGDTRTGQAFNHNDSYWPSAFRRDVWEFNVELAKEAVTEMGFNEIQFDYVRFPDRTYALEKSGLMDMKNTYQETKAQAIQGFLMYACDEIHQVGAYVSADVFGESAHNYVTGYGQYWGAISNIVDVISAMPYPDHFGMYEYGIDKPVWTVPYDLLHLWANSYVVKRQAEIPSPAKVRTWIQAYDTVRAPYIVYDATKISEQIQALYDAGLRGGYMTWNASSSLTKYEKIAKAFEKEY